MGMCGCFGSDRPRRSVDLLSVRADVCACRLKEITIRVVPILLNIMFNNLPLFENDALVARVV